MVEGPVEPESDPVIVGINEDPAVDFRDWLASRSSAGRIDIGGMVTDVIRDIRERGES